MWHLSGLLTSSLPRIWCVLPGVTLGMICPLTPLCCLGSGSGALFREPAKVTSPVFSDSLEVPPGPLGVVGQEGLISPIRDREGPLANQDPQDTEVLFLSAIPICCHQPSLGFGLARGCSSWKSGPVIGISLSPHPETTKVTVACSEQLIQAGILMTMSYVVLGCLWEPQKSQRTPLH